MQEPRTVSNTHSTLKLRDRVRVEYIANHAIRLALVEPSLRTTRHDPTGILTPVLQEGQALANLRRHIDPRVVQKYAEYTAHCSPRRSVSVMIMVIGGR